MKLELVTKDMYGEVFSNIYKCNKILSSKGTNYKYFDENGVENDIYFLDKKVLMSRKGEIITKQIYSLEAMTKSVYKTPYLTTEFEIKTLKFEKKNKGFFLEYELYTEGNIVNKIELLFNEK